MQKACILILMSIAGCASTGSANIHFLSQPEGAEIVADSGKTYGRTPVTVTLKQKTGFFIPDGIAIPPVTAKWVSGATVRYQGAKTQPGYETTVTLIRPKSAPDADIDERFAQQFKQPNTMDGAAR